MLRFFKKKSISTPQTTPQKWYLLIGWYPASVYVFHIHLLCFLRPAMERHLTDTNTLFHLCVMSHGAVNYLFFLSGVAARRGGGVT